MIGLIMTLMSCLLSHPFLLAESVHATQEAIANLVNLSTINPRIQLDIRYATSNNFLGFPVYDRAACYLHKEVAEALNEVQIELESLGLGLKVFDGYRPLHVQQLMWDTIQDERYVTNPAKNKGRHTRGTAIDLTLVDREGNELEMPSEFDDFTELAHSDFEDVSSQARSNRELLKIVMEKHGFIQFPFEWWHFDFSGWNDDLKYPPLDVTFEELEKHVR
jgi:zinc D-Ala-D-Ala dipeptidase